MCFLYHHHCWILESSCTPVCSYSYLVLILSVIWTHPVMYMKPVGIFYRSGHSMSQLTSVSELQCRPSFQFCRGERPFRNGVKKYFYSWKHKKVSSRASLQLEILVIPCAAAAAAATPATTTTTTTKSHLKTADSVTSPCGSSLFSSCFWYFHFSCVYNATASEELWD